MPGTQKLYKSIAQLLLTELQSGRYAVGDRMASERDLAVEHKVSRNTIREAFIVLEARGWIEIAQGSGARILRTANDSPIAFNDAEVGSFKLIEARRLVEGEICALAATGITPDKLEHLNALLVDMASTNREISERADREFHVTIARATGNEAIIAVVETLWDWRYWSASAKQLLVDVADNGMKDRIVEHRAIVEAIASGSAARAKSAMREHLDRVRDHMLAAVELAEINQIQRISAQRRLNLEARAHTVDRSGSDFPPFSST